MSTYRPRETAEPVPTIEEMVKMLKLAEKAMQVAGRRLTEQAGHAATMQNWLRQGADWFDAYGDGYDAKVAAGIDDPEERQEALDRAERNHSRAETLRAAAYGGHRKKTKPQAWDNLTPEEQFKLATRIASNVGYVLIPEPEHPDSPHRSDHERDEPAVPPGPDRDPAGGAEG